jgi:hypothetical protein
VLKYSGAVKLSYSGVLPIGAIGNLELFSVCTEYSLSIAACFSSCNMLAGDQEEYPKEYPKALLLYQKAL